MQRAVPMHVHGQAVDRRLQQRRLVSETVAEQIDLDCFISLLIGPNWAWPWTRAGGAVFEPAPSTATVTVG